MPEGEGEGASTEVRGEKEVNNESDMLLCVKFSWCFL